MNKTIRNAVVGLFALLCGGAFADGVPLFTPGGPAMAAPAVARMKANLPVKSMTPVTPDKNAINGNILTVDLGGKTYRFVGSKQTMKPSMSASAPSSRSASSASSSGPNWTLVPNDDGGDIWQGSTPEGDYASISRTKDGLHGRFLVGSEKKRHFQLVRQGSYAIVEFEDAPPSKTQSYDEPTFEMIEALRKRQQKATQGAKP